MTAAAARLALAFALAALLPACSSLSGVQRARVDAVVESSRAATLTCDRADVCATPSALHDLSARAFAASTPAQPRHHALILDAGTDALASRINLIRSATSAVDVQTYIFDEDDAGRLVLDELLAAAGRGVRVRVLIDQMAALRRVETLAALAAAHRNFELRIYNPVLGRARIAYWQYVVGTACCFRKLNQRMHTKLLVVDGAVAITGGRNYQDDYYDWDDEYNFRDRDVLVAGPIVRTMGSDFDAFWDDRRSKPVRHLVDVGRHLLAHGAAPLAPAAFERPARAQAMREASVDAARAQAMADRAIPVGEVRYISDLPDKHRDESRNGAVASRSLRELIESAQREVLLQTPYLVLSKPAQDTFRALQRRAQRPRVVVSTNSLASTDAFIAYALSYKYKRRYLREFGFEIYEYKPFPADAPIDLAQTGALPPLADVDASPAPPATADSPAGTAISPTAPGAALRAGTAAVASADAAGAPLPEAEPMPAAATTGSPAITAQSATPRLRARPDRRSVVWRGSSGRRDFRPPLARENAALRFGSRGANEPVPLQHAGVRIGMHAKSLVIDERIGVIGTHNFDPRGDHYNTESAVVIDDPVFARALADSIRRDIAPANSWVIARRDSATPFSGLEYSIAKASEYLPLFDLWPVRYATSYEFVPGPQCPAPMPPRDPRFRACYRAVGDFPEVDLGLKSLTTRIFTAFGAGLAPIL